MTTTDDDIRQLRDAVRGTIGALKDDTPAAPDLSWRARWSGLVELGLPALCVPEERGGSGMEVLAAVATTQELGAALHASPFAGITASACALGRQPDGAAGTLLADVLSGDRVCVFGVLDEGRTVAHAVDGASDADAAVLLEPASGELLLVADAAGATAAPATPVLDLSRTCADLLIHEASAEPLAPVPEAAPLHRLLLAADAVGGVQRMLDRTVSYAGERITFGKPIGGFQAVQHRLVDHTIRARGLALVVAEAARLLGDGSPDAARQVVLAEVAVSNAAVHILHDLLQLTGGIGFTWEYGLHFYTRRVHHDARLVGNPRAAVQALAVLEGWSTGDGDGR